MPLTLALNPTTELFLLFRRQRDWDRIGQPTEPMPPPRTFAEFWPQYVLAHRRPTTRAFHCAGTLLAWALLAAAILLRPAWRAWLVPAAAVAPYALAWLSHFFVEHNRPASFGHPLWSWWAEQKMVALMLVGKMAEEVRRCAGKA